MSVPPFENSSIEKEKQIRKYDGDSSNLELTQLYKEGKEFTYLVCVSGKTSNHVVKFTPGFKNITSVEVVQARIPYTEYTIEDDRNTFDFEIGGGKYRITIPSRNYNNEELVDMFNAKAKDGVYDINTNEEVTSHNANKIRLGEQQGTGKFFFYTQQQEENIPFKILETTTALYPFGLSDNASQYTDSGQLKMEVLNYTESVTVDTYAHGKMCENRYDLVVTDSIMLRCEELDRELKRGYQTESVMPLYDFFMSSPGMEAFQKVIPDRPINPPLSLETFSLNFTRKKRGDTRQDYNFRGIDWHLKLKIKTLEMPSSIDGDTNKQTVIIEDRSNLEDLTNGFKKLSSSTSPGIRRQIFQGPKQGVSSMNSTLANGGMTTIPSAYNNDVYGSV